MPIDTSPDPTPDQQAPQMVSNDPQSQPSQQPEAQAAQPSQPTASQTGPQSAPQGPTANTPSPSMAGTVSNAPTPPVAPGTQPRTSNLVSNSTEPVQSGFVPTPAAPNVATTSPNPSVRKAGWLREVATAMTGGTPYRVTIDENGNTIRTPAPLKPWQLSLALIGEVLSGGAAGAAQHGPGATGRAFLAGSEQGIQQVQARNQAVEQRAANDAKQRAESLSQKANIANLQSRTILNVAESESKGAETLQKYADQNKDLIQSYDDAGQLLRRHMTQQELTAGLRDKSIDMFSQLGPVDGYVLLGDGRVEATHALISDPNVKVPLTQEMADRLSAAHIQGWPQGMKVPDGYMIQGTILAIENEELQSLNLAQQRHDEVIDSLSKSSSPEVKAMAAHIPTIDSLLSDPQKGAGLQSSISKFQAYISHADVYGTGHDLYTALQAMNSPSMPDPINKGKFIPNPNRPFAARIAASYSPNGDDPKQGWAILKAYHDEITPEPIKSEADAASIIANNPPGSKPYRIAQRWIQSNTQQKAATASADAQARAQAENASGNPNPLQYANEAPINGVRQNYLNSLPPGQADLIKAVGEDRTELNSRTASTKDGRALMQQITTAYPGYDFSRAPEYAATRKAFTSGKEAQAVNALSTAMGHMLVMYNNASLGASMPLVSGVERSFGNQSAIDLANAKTALVDELGKAYKAGALTDQDVRSWKNRIDVWSPKEIKGNAKSFVQLLDSKLSSYESQWKNGSPPGAVAPIEFLSPEARTAYQTITGRQPITGTQEAQPGTPRPTPFIKITSDGKLGWNGTAWVPNVPNTGGK